MKRIFFVAVMLAAILTTAHSTFAQTKTGATTLSGTVVCCEECWAEADRKTTPFGTRSDLAKSVQCVASGDPSLLAVQGAGGEFALYQLEFGKYKTAAKNWLEHIGQRIEVTGTAGTKKNKPFIKVDTLSVLARASAETEPQVNAVGTEVELAMVDLFGVEQRLSAYRGRIVVLNFWATYCVPCVKEMPELGAIQNRHAALGVQVIGAAADAVDSKPKVLQFIKTHKVNFPVWLGATAADMERFGLGSALPGTVIIGRDGKVAATIRGVFKIEELNKLIETLLAKADREEKQKVAALGKESKASSVPS